MKDNEVIKDFGTISEDIDKLILSKDNTSFDAVMNILLCKLDVIKIRQKIGLEQRMFFTYFFRELFNPNSDSYLNIKQAIETGFYKYSSLI